MIHLYHGEGKGKTTAACGLALRASGHGLRVLFAQFFKDGTSGEIAAMSALPRIVTRRPPVHYGRYGTLNEEQREEVRACTRAYLHELLREAEKYDLVVLDEIVSAYNYDCVDREELLRFLRAEGTRREIVLTGRSPAPELVELADYVTEMRNEKHPYDQGVAAREGVEY